MDSLLEKTLSFQEAEKQSKEKKTVQHAKEAYLKEVNCSSWEEAVEELPEYSRMEVLSKYMVPKSQALSNKFKVSKQCT